MNMHVSRRRPLRTARRPLSEIAADLDYTSDWNWAWDNYKATIVALARDYGLDRHLEVGGGRDTLFTPEEAAAHRFDITVNDVSPHELALAPDGFGKVCCDIASPRTMSLIRPEQFDFVYSRMVMEHVRDVPLMWRNMHSMLSDGGVALAFYPTLFAPPFAINHVVPERLSSAILEKIFPDRHSEGDNPKFPAFYDHCYGDEAKIAPMLKDIGFREVLVLPFYGYSYFWKIPALKQLDAAFTRTARERDWRLFTSFAYTIAVK
jgi:SAM-dependent methyltransferase